MSATVRDERSSEPTDNLVEAESPETLSLRDVSYTPPGAAAPILHSVDVVCRCGEVTVIVGPNGAGKSTLLRLLSGLIEPTTGQVLNAGGVLPSNDRTRARLLHLVGSEQVPMFDFNVEQVVSMGRYPHRGRAGLGNLDEEARRLIRSALDHTDIQPLAERSVLQLSSGELRRVWIARALVSEARYLLLDEPTANLDLAHSLTVLELARSLACKGHGVIMALHDLQGAFEVADQVVLLERGRLVASGSRDSVLTVANVEKVFSVRFEAESPTDPNSLPRLKVSSATAKDDSVDGDESGADRN